MSEHYRQLLLIEPDAAVRTALAMVFRQQGWSVVTKKHIGNLKNGFSDTPLPDLVLTESTRIGVPASKLLTFFSDKGIPVIFTGHDRAVQLAVDLIQSGAMDFLEKPFPQARLLQTIKRLKQR